MEPEDFFLKGGLVLNFREVDAVSVTRNEPASFFVKNRL